MLKNITRFIDTAKNAAGPRWYVLGGIFSAIVGATDWLEEGLRKLFSEWMSLPAPKGDPTMIFGFPSWIVGLTIFLAFLSFIFLNHARKLTQQLDPSIRIIYADDAPWKHRIKGGIFTEPGGKGKKPGWINYVRFQVENTTPDTVIRGCECYLAKIWRKVGGAEFQQVSSGDSLRLPWSARPSDKIHSGLAIPYSLDVFCDLFYVDEIHNKIQPQWDVLLNANFGILEPHGTYRFDVIVISEKGGPVSKSIYLEWTGEWDNLRTWTD